MYNDIKTRWLGPFSLRVTAQIVPPPIDVDYVDITDVPITDPARMLPQKSVHPFWVEDRRREAQHNDIMDFTIALEAMFRDFYRNKLILVRGANHCPFRWEHEYSEKLLDSFLEFEETVMDALKKFFGPAYHYSGCLWDFFGYNDEEFAQMLKVEKEKSRRQDLHNDFQHAVYCLLHKSVEPDDDLPF